MKAVAGNSTPSTTRVLGRFTSQVRSAVVAEDAETSLEVGGRRVVPWQPPDWEVQTLPRYLESDARLFNYGTAHTITKWQSFTFTTSFRRTCFSLPRHIDQLNTAKVRWSFFWFVFLFLHPPVMNAIYVVNSGFVKLTYDNSCRLLNTKINTSFQLIVVKSCVINGVFCT